MAALVTETERAWQALGGIQYGPTEAEKSSLRFRRSIYIAQDVKADAGVSVLRQIQITYP